MTSCSNLKVTCKVIHDLVPGYLFRSHFSSPVLSHSTSSCSSDTAAWSPCRNLAFAAPSTWNALAMFPSGWILLTLLRAELTILAKSYLIQSAFCTSPCSIICAAHITTWIMLFACLFFLAFPTAKWASLVAQIVRNLPSMWETQVQSLGWEGPLEEEMATHYSILTWRIPQSIGLQRVRHDWVTNTFTAK